MSNLFLQNTLNNIFDTVTESKTELPQWVNIIDYNVSETHNKASTVKQQGGSRRSKSYKNKYDADSATSSAFIGQFGGAGADSATSSAFIGQFGGAEADSATSSAFIGQFGGAGADSATSSAFIGQFGGAHHKKQSGGTNNEVNKLVSMLTSESQNNNLNGLSETNTETLEAQLRDILKQDGGAKKNKQKAQAGGSSNVEDIRSFFTNLKSQGVNVNVKLNDKSLSEFFDLAQNTTTEVADIGLKNITGGAKKSKKSSKKSKKSELLDGGANAGFQAFLDFKKHVANKLKISNGPSAAKIAGSINAEMKKKHSDLSAVEIAKKNTEYSQN